MSAKPTTKQEGVAKAAPTNPTSPTTKRRDYRLSDGETVTDPDIVAIFDLTLAQPARLHSGILAMLGVIVDATGSGEIALFSDSADNAPLVATRIRAQAAALAAEGKDATLLRGHYEIADTLDAIACEAKQEGEVNTFNENGKENGDK